MNKKRLISLVSVNILFTIIVIILVIILLKLNSSVEILKDNKTIENTTNDIIIEQNIVIEEPEEIIEEPEEQTLEITETNLTEESCDAWIETLDENRIDAEQDYNDIEYMYYEQQEELNEAEEYVLEIEAQIANTTDTELLSILYDEYNDAKDDLDREEDRFREDKYALKIADRAVTDTLDALREAYDICRDI